MNEPPADAFEAQWEDQLVRWALTSPEERLAWLWQAKLFAAQALGAASLAGHQGSADSDEEPPPHAQDLGPQRVG